MGDRGEPREPRGRYHVEAVASERGQRGLADEATERMNERDAQGWRLVGVTQQGSMVLLYWDTTGGGLD